MELYPNVAADPSMYCPRVLIGPFGPPPYLMILKPPAYQLHTALREKVEGRTEQKPHYKANSCKRNVSGGS